MIVTKKALPRRTVLRGIGATVALPFLDAMAPALTATARTAAPVKVNRPGKRQTGSSCGGGNFCRVGD